MCELKSKLQKGGCIGDYIGEYTRSLSIVLFTQ